jgi:hypothetical protein
MVQKRESVPGVGVTLTQSRLVRRSATWENAGRLASLTSSWIGASIAASVTWSGR